jgi:hypothetical protein
MHRGLSFMSPSKGLKSRDRALRSSSLMASLNEHVQAPIRLRRGSNSELSPFASSSTRLEQRHHTSNVGSPKSPSARSIFLKRQTSTASPAEPEDLPWWLVRVWSAAAGAESIRPTGRGSRAAAIQFVVHSLGECFVDLLESLRSVRLDVLQRRPDIRVPICFISVDVSIFTAAARVP